jgi:hypothetical protein
MNNNTTKQTSSLERTTNTKAGTTEYGAMKDIHRGYNKLNGYEAMLHIINRYKFVLYPFIALSIAGSSYSFYNDFLKAFPALGVTANLFIAIFFSIMLEIVRDGSLIALFNGKMKVPSRTLIIAIFIIVTTYMYSSHIKAIHVIEKIAIEYALEHQTDQQKAVKNPKYSLIKSRIESVKKDIANKRGELTKELLANTTSVYKAKRESAISLKASIENTIQILKDKKSKLEDELLSLDSENISDIKESQKLISKILLATLLLVESLAMLGAVIKFINKDNADKEVAKHSEIIEEYKSISEQMRTTNDELGLMLSNDTKRMGEQQLAYIQALAETRNMFQAQMGQILSTLSDSPMINHIPINKMPNPKELSQVDTKYAEHQAQQKPMKRIGFNIEDKDDLIKNILDNVERSGDKLPSKTNLIDIKNRRHKNLYEKTMRDLKGMGVVEYKRGSGYYMAVDRDTAKQEIFEAYN